MPFNNKFNKNGKKKVDNYSPPYNQEILSKSIDTLNLPEEILEKLKAAKIDTIFAVCKLDAQALLHVNRFNKKNLFVLEKALKNINVNIKPTEIKPIESQKDSSTKNGQNSSIPDKDKKTNPYIANKKQFDNIPKTILTEAQEKELRDKNRPKSQPIVDSKDIYVKVNKNDKWGFETRFGKEAIPCIYDEIFSFKEDLCCVMQNEKYGFIDRNGVVVIPLEYDLASSFSEGYACVFRGEKCGYIDKENNLIIKFLFEAGTAVEDGGCRVKKDGKWGELHLLSPEDIRWIV